MSSDPNDLPLPPPPAEPPSRPPDRVGLAIAALALGAASLLLSVVVVGGLIGIVGAIMALVHFFRRPEQRRGLAAAGLVLSLLGLVASAGFGIFYYSVVGDYIRMMANVGDSQKWVGVESPDFTVTTLDGETFKLSDFRGKRVVVDYWATWCGPCVKEAPHFNRLRQTVSENDLAMVGISSESESEIRPFLTTHNVGYPLASADNLPSPYSNIWIIPTTFFIDRNGIIQSILVGYQDFDAIKKHSTASDYEGELKPAPSS